MKALGPRKKENKKRKRKHGMDNDELRKLLKQFLGKTPHPRICSPWIIKTN